MSFDSGRLSHAYITDDSFVNTLSMAVVCGERDASRPCKRCVHCDKASRNIHPDITVVGKAAVGKAEDKLIVSVDQIRDLKKDVYIVPNDSIQKAYVINDADSMNASAQNALLQILEEPPAHAVFILCTGNPATLLPTVRSRCVDASSKQIVESDAVVAADHIDSDDDSSDLEELADEFVSALTGDNVKLMECMFLLEKLNRVAFSEFTFLAREKLALALRERSGSKDTVVCKRLVDAESVLLKSGEMLDLSVSVGHISGFICASLVDLGK